jgi:hypothetical protein
MDNRVSRRTVITGLTAMIAAPAIIAPARAERLPLTPQEVSGEGVTLTIRDYSPRFLDFHAAAQGLDPDARWKAWQDRYGFAAVPPGPEGEAVARRLLDAAWPRYPAALPLIRRGAAGMTPAPLDSAVAIARLFRATTPLRIGVIAYVGGFEDNAFTAGTPDGPLVCLPIEMDPARRAMLLPHEMTHAVHMLLAKLPDEYERPLGRVLFEEGLAMHAVAALRPGLADWAYVGEQPWYDAALARRADILAAITPLLDASDGPTLFRFTMGQGATGREREAYLAAWLVMGALLKQGRTLPDLVRLPADAIVPLVRETLGGLKPEGS